MTTLDEYLKRAELPGYEVTPIEQATVDFERTYLDGTAAEGESAWRMSGELLAMLRELEWSGVDDGERICPVCLKLAEPMFSEPAHCSDCRLDALLRRYRR